MDENHNKVLKSWAACMDMENDIAPVVGFARRLAKLLKKLLFLVSQVWKNQSFLLIYFQIVQRGDAFTVGNIYGPYEDSQR